MKTNIAIHPHKLMFVTRHFANSHRVIMGEDYATDSPLFVSPKVAMSYAVGVSNFTDDEFLNECEKYPIYRH
jgi:hypothetical protein